MTSAPAPACFRKMRRDIKFSAISISLAPAGYARVTVFGVIWGERNLISRLFGGGVDDIEDLSA
jgi:hypothetical protein